MRLVLFAFMMLNLTVCLSAQTGTRGGGRGATAQPMTMTVSGFPDGGQIPVEFSQAVPGVAPGEGKSPAIQWANAPAGTQSFVLNMHDMDLARNKTTDDRCIGWCGIFPHRQRDWRKARRRGRNCRTAVIRSAPQGLCTAVLAPARTGRSITICSNSTRWTPSWM